MKTVQVTKRIGENMGPIDYTYDFRSHYKSWGIAESRKDEICDKSIAMLREMESNPGKYQATTDGGWPRFSWGEVLAVGMWDGWPYWYPVPCVFTKGPLGGEWHTFSDITGYELIHAPK